MTDGAGRRVRRSRPEVGRPAGRRHLRGEPFELSATDVLEVLAGRIRRRLFVEVDGNTEPLGDRGADVLRQRDAVRHGDALDRDEGHDVDGAETRMLALVLTQVDGRHGLLEQREHGRFERGGVADQREDGSVVRRVG